MMHEIEMPYHSIAALVEDPANHNSRSDLFHLRCELNHPFSPRIEDSLLHADRGLTSRIMRE